MKRTLAFTIVMLIVLMLAMAGTAAAAPKADKTEVYTITAGEVYYSQEHYLGGQPIPMGFDEFGYNYQAHFFKGSYVNVYLGAAGYPPYTGDDEAYLAENPNAQTHWAWEYRAWQIEMKWNEDWISNKDRDLDGVLDRHWGYDTYIGSGAWEYYKDWLYDDNGNVISSSSCKIVVAPADAYLSNGIWYSADGNEIGPVIWTNFAIVKETIDGEITYSSPLRCGFGNW